MTCTWFNKYLAPMLTLLPSYNPDWKTWQLSTRYRAR